MQITGSTGYTRTIN